MVALCKLANLVSSRCFFDCTVHQYKVTLGGPVAHRPTRTTSTPTRRRRARENAGRRTMLERGRFLCLYIVRGWGKTICLGGNTTCQGVSNYLSLGEKLFVRGEKLFDEEGETIYVGGRNYLPRGEYICRGGESICRRGKLIIEGGTLKDCEAN